MLIYRGWGLFFVIAFPALGFVAGQRLFGAENVIGARLGFVVGALVGVGFSWWLNIIRPKQQAEQWRETRNQELQALVQSGQFALPDFPPPSSWAEADQQAREALEQESDAVHRGMRNRHTVFFIPVQWPSVAILAASVFALFAAVTG